ncbi:MAG: tetratricopeptide repeat protein [Proteobacteria bacterium]|nr:tetratricopeptide repeat protein [Pseudomonadota bacterium]
MSPQTESDAVRAFQSALARDPADLDALAGLGAALRGLGRTADAEAALRRALAIRPDHPAALRTLTGLLQLQSRFAEAIALADAALAADPQSGEAWLARGDSLMNQGKLEAALASYEPALGSSGAGLEAQVRTGMALGALGQAQAAVAAFDAALAAHPTAAAPRYQRGILRLSLRDFAEGWADYEARWRTPRFLAASRGLVPDGLVPRLAIAPTVADLAGKRVLLLGEQGIGDQIMFASMIPDLAAVAKHVICICEPRLVGLFGRAFPDVEVLSPTEARIEEGAVDLVLAMGSLGHAFRRSAEAFPRTAYLTPGEAARRRWAERLRPADGRLRVGLSWRGGVAATRRDARSIPLADLSPVLEIPGCEFVSLQYGEVADEIDAWNRRGGPQLRAFPPDASHDGDDLAASVAAVDLVVSVQTAVVHVAGAVGRDALVLLPTTPEWRYMQAGDTLPWYGAVRLIRQAEPGDWGAAVGEAAARVRAGRTGRKPAATGDTA